MEMPKGPLIYQTIISDNSWHRVSAGRNTTHAYVGLDGVNIYRKTNLTMVGLDVKSLLYAGKFGNLLFTSSWCQVEKRTL